MSIISCLHLYQDVRHPALVNIGLEFLPQQILAQISPPSCYGCQLSVYLQAREPCLAGGSHHCSCSMAVISCIYVNKTVNHCNLTLPMIESRLLFETNSTGTQTFLFVLINGINSFSSFCHTNMSSCYLVCTVISSPFAPPHNVGLDQPIICLLSLTYVPNWSFNILFDF